MKNRTIIYCLFMILPCSVMSQVIVADSLINNSETLKLNRGGFLVSSDNVHKISFGPFKTVNIRKGKQHLVGRQNDAYFDIKGKNAGVKKSVSKINSQPFSLTIIQDAADTIISNMAIITVKGGNHALIEISNSKAADEESSISYCEDLLIQIREDTLNWHMPQTIDPQTDDPDFPLSFDGTISNGTDNILVKGAQGFPVKRKIFTNSTKGIVFLHNKKQVAALETYPETSIWFSNTINAHHKQVIAAVIISLLSLSNSIMK